MLQTLCEIYAKATELLELPYMVIGIISGIFVMHEHLKKRSAV